MYFEVLCDVDVSYKILYKIHVQVVIWAKHVSPTNGFTIFVCRKPEAIKGHYDLLAMYYSDTHTPTSTFIPVHTMYVQVQLSTIHTTAMRYDIMTYDICGCGCECGCGWV